MSCKDDQLKQDLLQIILQFFFVLLLVELYAIYFPHEISISNIYFDYKNSCGC